MTAAQTTDGSAQAREGNKDRTRGMYFIIDFNTAAVEGIVY